MERGSTKCSNGENKESISKVDNDGREQGRTRPDGRNKAREKKGK